MDDKTQDPRAEVKDIVREAVHEALDQREGSALKNADGRTIVPPESGSVAAGIIHNTSVTNLAGTTVDAASGVAVEQGAGGTYTQADVAPPAGNPGFEAAGGAPSSPADPSHTEPVAEVTPPESQAETVAAESVAGDIVPGAVTGPDEAGVVRTETGRTADAPAGSMDAAFNGVQKDNTSGVVTSNNTDEVKTGPTAAAPPAETPPSEDKAQGEDVTDDSLREVIASIKADGPESSLTADGTPTVAAINAVLAEKGLNMIKAERRDALLAS